MTDHPHPENPAGTPGGGPGDLRSRIIEVLRTVYDPEIPVDIYELGLVYDIDIDDSGSVSIRMTLTSPMCPVAGSLPPEVEAKVGNVPGVAKATVELVWDPPWDPSKMTEAARLKLGM
jgi:FeS assembly SUF system protein